MDEILNLIESVSEGFTSYSFTFLLVSLPNAGIYTLGKRNGNVMLRQAFYLQHLCGGVWRP